jgi:hypothetical protein
MNLMKNEEDDGENYRIRNFVICTLSDIIKVIQSSIG